MNTSYNWPTRQQWAADAEHATRTTMTADDRVSNVLKVWLTAEELAEAHQLVETVVKATRTALTRAGRGGQRSELNAHGREARGALTSACGRVHDLNSAARPILRFARDVGAAPGSAARLGEILTAMNRTRDGAAKEAERKAIAAAIAFRNSDEGWNAELKRRARVERGPQVTHVTIHADDTCTVGEPRPYRRSA